MATYLIFIITRQRMLKIRYFKKFRSGNPFIVVLCDEAGAKKAHGFFHNQAGAYLDDEAVTDHCEISPLTRKALYMNEQECRKIAGHFKNLAGCGHAAHAYMDTEALDSWTEIMISLGEYDEKFQLRS